MMDERMSPISGARSHIFRRLCCMCALVRDTISRGHIESMSREVGNKKNKVGDRSNKAKSSWNNSERTQ